MNGTEKQIEWANTIKAEFSAVIAKFATLAAANAAADAAVKAVIEAYDDVLVKDSAACWIDLRDYVSESAIKSALKDQMSGKELWINTAKRTWIAGNNPRW